MSLLLETVSGRKIDVLNPDPKDISIEDIAWGLSRIPRFCGATIPFVPYSVAQHSIQVMKECNSIRAPGPKMFNLAFHGLMHDAAEAYIGDIPSPIKQIPGFKEKIKEVENKLLATIYKAFDTELPNEEDAAIVHNADMVQRAIEAYNFMYSRGKDWNLPPIPFQKLQEFDPPMISIKANDMFLQNFNMIKGMK
jgi:5'-deoxynucleotidase YfbR-like HD superfamily hydrolase